MNEILTVIGSVIVAAIGAAAGYLGHRAAREAAKLQADEKRHEIDSEEMRLFRQELRQELREHKQRIETLEQELASARISLARAEGEMQGLRSLFSSVLGRLESLVLVPDIQQLREGLNAIVVTLRRILDLPIGEPEIALRLMREARMEQKEGEKG